MPLLTNHYFFYPLVWAEVINGVYRRLITDADKPQKFNIKVERYQGPFPRPPRQRRRFGQAGESLPQTRLE